MSFVPYAALWILIVAAAVVCLPAGRRPRLPAIVSSVATLVALGLWALFRPAAVTPSLSFAGRQWAIGEVGWILTGIVLLLLLSVAVHALLQPAVPHATRHALSLGMAAAALPAIWAADGRTRIMGVTFFVVVWAFSRWYGTVATGTDWRSWLGGSSRLWVAVFPLWAAAALPAGHLSLLLSMTGVAILMGVWPFGGWRRGDETEPLSMLSNGLPVVVGAAVLAATLSETLPTAVELAAATAVGLLSLLVGLGQVWRQPAAITAALSLGLAGLAFATALWVGPEALPVAARLTVFAPLLVVMAFSVHNVLPSKPDPVDEARHLQLSPGLIAFVVVFAAVVGLPLTAGWGTLAALYEAWRAAGGWVLLFVALVLMTLWAATLYQIGRSLNRSAVSDRAAWLRALAFAPPIIGLFSLDFAATNAGLASWAAILISTVAGLLLGRFAPPMETVGDLLHEAVALPQSPTITIASRLSQTGRVIVDALADALTILEGENGLLWLLGLLLLLMWIA